MAEANTAVVEEGVEVATDLTVDGKMLSKAVDFAYKESPDLCTCPVCGVNKGFIPEAGKKNNALWQHLQKSHSDRVLAWYLYPEMGKDAMVELMRRIDEGEGTAPIGTEHTRQDVDDFDVVETHDAFDFNYLPKEVLRDIEKKGMYARWIPKTNAERRSYQGYQAYARPDGLEMDHQGSHEDTTLQSNERILMVIPKEKRERNQYRVKQELRERRETLYPSEENKGRPQLSDPGRAAYDHHINRGMSSQNAMKLANVAERKIGDAPGRKSVIRRPGYEGGH